MFPILTILTNMLCVMSPQDDATSLCNNITEGKTTN